MAATMADYHVLSDPGYRLSPQDELQLDFNPPNDIVLSGNPVHRPVLSFRVYVPVAENPSLTSRVTVKIGTTKLFDATKFQAGYTTIYEVLNFSNLTTGNQTFKFTTDSFGSISDVIIWYKRN
ncbi:hypothetical protein ACOTTU_12960 [Roseobacter sp. EG26]|uniref:hypothetical protein n=1 Tax=Roseobacter sp. EG26 TaxID=3412477 RepID=UPI0026060AA9|nr:hypothetical protein [uncultured Roseobacter sp.]